MAFVRYKKVNGKKYYQLVRNYRENGKHKQEVLYHLGPQYDSLEAVIKDVEGKATFYRNWGSANRADAERMEELLLEEYQYRRIYSFIEYLDELLLGDKSRQREIPHRRAAEWAIDHLEPYRELLRDYKEEPYSIANERYEKWGEKHKNIYFTPYDRNFYLAFHDQYKWRDFGLWEEGCQAAMDVANTIVEYHSASWNAYNSESRIDEYQETLDKLREIKQRYSL